VKVGPHGSHGSIATITLAQVPEDKRDAVIGEIDALFAPFVMRHEVVWA
jgi:fatty-acyl-CoA synthase